MANDMVEIEVDGRTVQARQGQTVLEVCRQAGRDVPTLCYHKGLEPYAACRVCLVELTASNRVTLVPSCQYPVGEGMSIQTDSPAVRTARRFVLELLLARCPTSKVIKDLAARYGVTQTPFPSDDPNETCILCGLCVRVCQECVGPAAIGFTSRGVDRRVGPPLDEASEACVGCQACQAVCPTGHVLSRDDKVRHMETWKTDLELARCESCGQMVAPSKQLEHVRSKLPQHVALPTLCARCRRGHSAADFARALKGQASQTEKESSTGAATSRQENQTCREK